MNVDRAVMDRKLFAALKPGGFLVIADHSALPGQGISVGKTLHRIEESALRQEVEAAGFHVVAEGDFWRSPEDTHDFPSYRPTTRQAGLSPAPFATGWPWRCCPPVPPAATAWN